MKAFTYKYEMPAVTATIAIFDINGNVLLGIRSKDSDAYPNMYCLPGGFLDTGKETIEQTAVREVYEETGLQIHPNDLRLFMVSSDPKTDPRYHVVNVCYFVVVDDLHNTKANDDISELEIFNYENLPDEENFAFNHFHLLAHASIAYDKIYNAY